MDEIDGYASREDAGEFDGIITLDKWRAYFSLLAEEDTGVAATSPQVGGWRWAGGKGA